MNIKNIAVLAVLLSCLAMAGGAVIMDSDDVDGVKHTICQPIP